MDYSFVILVRQDSCMRAFAAQDAHDNAALQFAEPVLETDQFLLAYLHVQIGDVLKSDFFNDSTH